MNFLTLQKGWDALVSLSKLHGYDTELGRRLYHEVSKRGFAELQAEGYVAMQFAGNSAARFYKSTLAPVQHQILEAGLLSSAELEDYRSLPDSREYRWFAAMMISVWDGAFCHNGGIAWLRRNIAASASWMSLLVLSISA
jgi:hypothetical protein